MGPLTEIAYGVGNARSNGVCPICGLPVAEEPYTLPSPGPAGSRFLPYKQWPTQYPRVFAEGNNGRGLFADIIEVAQEQFVLRTNDGRNESSVRFTGPHTREQVNAVLTVMGPSAGDIYDLNVPGWGLPADLLKDAREVVAIMQKHGFPIGEVEFAAPAPASQSTPSSASFVQELKRLAALHKAGALDDDEFKKAKEQFLGAKK